MTKPTVNTRPVASQYQRTPERIIEIGNGVRSMDGHKGALIGLSNENTGDLRIDVYRADAGVIILASGDEKDPYLSALATVTRTLLLARQANPAATEADYLRAVNLSTEDA